MERMFETKGENVRNATEIIAEFSAKAKSASEHPRENAADAIEALHPFAVSRLQRFCQDDLDVEYIRNCFGNAYLLEEALKAPPSKVPPKAKARVWMHYLSRADIDGYLARLVAKRIPGYEDFQNLSPDCFSAHIHPTDGNRDFKRPASRTTVEPFLRGEKSAASAIAFLRAAEKGSANFPVRAMFLYACANCPSVKRFAFIVKTLRPKLGRADFVDALGYSPFFYAAWRCTQSRGWEWTSWLLGDEGLAFFDLIRKAGARPDRKCRYGFSWRDLVEAVAEDAAEEPARCDAEESGADSSAPKRRKDGPLFVPTAAPEAWPVPSGDEIRKVLAEDPDRGIAALLAMDYEPESLAHPFGPRERILSDAICDRGIPKATRARLMQMCDCDDSRTCGRRNSLPSSPFAGLPPVEAREILPGFLDSTWGRRWASENNGPGGAEARCSDPAFFRNMARDFCGRVDMDRVTIDTKLRKEIDADSPAQLMMQLSVTGKHVDARLLAILLTLRKTKILEWLLENDEKTRELLDERRMLFYVCSNWSSEDAAAWLEKAEAKQPGILQSCVDALGRNLLWYSLYNLDGRHIKGTLLRHGCDPDAETAWGLSWRDVDGCPLNRGFEVSVNGMDIGDLWGNGQRNRDERAKTEDVSVVRIVRRGTGETFEWKCSEKGVKLLNVMSRIRDDEVPGVVFCLKRGYREVDATFKLGPDGIVRLAGVERIKGSIW